MINLSKFRSVVDDYFPDLKGSPQPKSPFSIDVRITPIPEGISWKDCSPDQQISEVREIQRSNAEYWAYFSNICPYFPETGSSEEAKELLDRFKAHPHISQFIPLFSKISYPKTLTITYERLKKNFLSAPVLDICAYYLFNRCLQDRKLCSEAAGLLRGPGDLNVYDSLTNRSIFEDAYKMARQDPASLPLFVKKLFELIPLEEIAEIRLNLEMIAIVSILNGYLNPSDRFEEEPIHGYSFYKKNISDLKNWLESKKDQLAAITSLNLSQKGVQRLPKDLLPYLCGVEEVYLSNSVVQDPAILIDLLKLPSLKLLDFSSNEFADFSIFAKIVGLPLQKALASAKQLESLHLFGNNLSFNDIPNLIKVCLAHSTDLILDIFSDEEQDLVSIFSEINEQLSEPFQFPMPTSSLLYPDQFRNELFAFLEERKEAIGNIEHLNLSNRYINFFPLELIPSFSSLTSVDFSENFYEGADLFPAITNLLRLEKLETINLAHNHIDNDFLIALAPHILASNTIKKISLGNNPIDLDALPEFTAECLARGIDISYSMQKNQSELITFCNSTDMFTSPAQYSTSFYKSILRALPRDLQYLDLSKASTSNIPEEIVPYYAEVERVKFSGIQNSSDQAISMIKSILKLPKLQSVDLSSNGLTDEDLSSLIEDFKGKPFLKTINLADNPWDPTLERNQELIQYCQENGIILWRPYSKKELDFLVVLLHLEELFSFSGMLTPNSFRDETDITRQMPDILEKFKDELAATRHLDFSNVKIDTFPSVLIPYFSGVTSVCLRNTTPNPIESPNRSAGIKNHQLLANMLNLQNLEEIDFSYNDLSLSSFLCLRTLIQNDENKLKKIDISHCTARPDLLKELRRLCSTHNIALISRVPDGLSSEI